MSESKKESRLIPRREIVCGLCAAGLSPSLALGANSNSPDANLPPQENDILVHAFGDKEGQPLKVADLEMDSKQIFAYPMEPQSGVIRNASRINQVVLIKLDPASLSEVTAARSTSGVVAYSGVCSHTGCDVTDWNGEFKRFQCPCHESQFDPSDAAKVVGGPAPWQLAALPLKEVDGVIAVNGPFEGRVGFQQPGLSPFGL